MFKNIDADPLYRNVAEEVMDELAAKIKASTDAAIGPAPTNPRKTSLIRRLDRLTGSITAYARINARRDPIEAVHVACARIAAEVVSGSDCPPEVLALPQAAVHLKGKEHSLSGEQDSAEWEDEELDETPPDGYCASPKEDVAFGELRLSPQGVVTAMFRRTYKPHLEALETERQKKLAERYR